MVRKIPISRCGNRIRLNRRRSKPGVMPCPGNFLLTSRREAASVGCSPDATAGSVGYPSLLSDVAGPTAPLPGLTRTHVPSIVIGLATKLRAICELVGWNCCHLQVRRKDSYRPPFGDERNCPLEHHK